MSTDEEVWQCAIDKSELETARLRNAVIATRLRGGRTVIRVLADVPPGNGFEPVEAGLEDVYFATLYLHRAKARAQEPAPLAAAA